MRRATSFVIAAAFVGAIVIAAPFSALAANLVLQLGAAPASISEGGSVQPFAGITVTDDENVTTTVTLGDPTDGSLSGAGTTGTAQQVEDYLDQVVFTGAVGFTGTAQVTVQVENQTQSDSDTVSISVNPTLPGPNTISITANATAVYGAGTPALTPTISNDADKLTVQPTCSYLGGAPVNPAVGNYSTTCAGAVAPGYTISYPPGALVVSPAAATITASDGSATYGQALPAITASYSGLQYGETTVPGVTCVSAALAVPSVASNCSGAASGNYSYSYVPGTVTVSPVGLVITPTPGTSTYGAVATIAPSFAGFVNSETKAVITTQPLCTTTVIATTPVGGYPASASCTGAVAVNYTITYGAAAATTVTPAPLTITALGQSRLVGQANGAFTVSSSGFVNSEGLANLAGTLQYTTSATTSSGPGSYPVQPSGVSSPNYAISFVPGIIQVTAVTPPKPSPTPTLSPTPTPTPTPSPTTTRSPSPSPSPTSLPVVPTGGFDWLPVILIGAGVIFIIALTAIILWGRRAA